jgi:triosephosphate isomerase
MREKIVAGNWKMNTTPRQGVELAGAVVEAVKGIKVVSNVPFDTGVTVVICPPATHLAMVGQALKGTTVSLGAQNVHWEDKGAFTGEIASGMLEECGCKWAIIGHSERRQLFGETDGTVNRRLRKAVTTGLRPIVCIGETLSERDAGKAMAVISRQLRAALEGVPLAGRGGVVIAYEPVWAIGTGRNATPEQAQEIHHFIRKTLAGMYDAGAADETVIQYGGSVTDKNAVELMACKDVDGGLIGGASLKPDVFAMIVKAAAQG